MFHRSVSSDGFTMMRVYPIITILLLSGLLPGLSWEPSIGEPIDHPPIRIEGNLELTPENGVTGGSGTVDDPYIIEDYNISGSSGDCVFISGTDKYLVLRNMVLSGSEYSRRGLVLNDVRNCSILNVTAQDFLRGGLAFFDCEATMVSSSVCISSNIRIFSSRSVSILDSDVRDLGGGEDTQGVYIEGSSNCSVIGCSIENVSMEGIMVVGSDGTIISDNMLSSILVRGFKTGDEVRTEAGLDVSGNSANHSISIYYMDDVTISSNIVDGSSTGAIRILYSNVTDISHNRMATAGLDIALSCVEQGRMGFLNNTLGDVPIKYLADARDIVLDEEASQYLLVNCTDCIVTNVSLADVRTGIGLYYCEGVEVSDCELSLMDTAIIDISGSNNTIDDCWFDDCRYGVRLLGTSHTSIEGNRFAACWKSVSPEGGHGLSMVGNGFSDCDYGLTSEWDSVPLVDFNVIENEFTDVDLPISVYAMESSTIGSNFITGYSPSGIRIWSGADNVSILNNKIMDRIGQGGTGSGAMYINLGRGCNISGNVLIDCDSLSLKDVDGSFVADNILTLGAIRGVYAIQSDNNTIVRNLISNHEKEAIRLWGTGNLVHHNTFITDSRSSDHNQSLAISSYDSVYNKDNHWDDGSEGNYWSNYVGRYPLASADGRLWDSPYYIDDTGDIHVLDEHPLTLVPDFKPPTAVAGDDLIVEEGTEVALNGNRSFDDSGILSYSWSIESPEGMESLMGETIEFLFLVPGEYEVTLQVSDPWGNRASDTIVVEVLDVLPPVASIEGDLEVGQSEEVNLDGRGSTDSGGIANYTWRMVTDGGIHVSFGPIFNMTFDDAGNHTVELTVLDAVGHNDSATAVIRVRDTQSPVAVIAGTLEVAQDEWVHLFGNSSIDNEGIASMTWHIALVEQPLDHTGNSFSFRTMEIGSFQVSLTVNDAEGNKGRALVFLTVLDVTPPVAHAGSNRNVDIDTTFVFDGSDSSDNVAIVTYSWELAYGGSNRTFDGPEAEFTFTKAGKYVVTLTVVDAAGLKDTDEITVTVEQDRDPDQITPFFLFVILASGIVLFATLILYFSKVHGEEKGST